MVTLPRQFIATKYYGYFWNSKEKVLYSLKQDGVLKPMKHRGPNSWSRMSGYPISNKGNRRWLTDDYLATLTPNDSEIPVRIV